MERTVGFEEKLALLCQDLFSWITNSSGQFMFIVGVLVGKPDPVQGVDNDRGFKAACLT